VLAVAVRRCRSCQSCQTAAAVRRRAGTVRSVRWCCWGAVRLRAGGLTLAHLRGSTDYRSCQHLAQRSVLAQSNGSPKTSVSTPLERCWHTLRVKPGYTCKKPGIPEKYLGPRQCRARPTPRAPAPTAARTACSSTRTAPCALATSAKRHGLQVAVRTMRSCRHSASSATLGRGLHRRVDPLAERQGALAAHAAGYASRQGLPQKYLTRFFWHPHHCSVTPKGVGQR